MDVEDLIISSGSLRASLVEALIAASYFSDTSWKETSIDLARRFVHEDVFHKGLVAARASTLYRLQRNLTASTDHIVKFFPSNTNLRGRVQTLFVGVSAALNDIEHDQMKKAAERLESILQSCATSNPMGLLAAFRTRLTLARNFRYRGLFQEALSHARSCLETAYADTLCAQDRAKTVVEVADLYCELEQPAKAQKLATDELQHLRKAKSNARWARHLRLYLAETMI